MAHMSGKTMYGNLEHKFQARVQLNPINEQTRKERSFSPLLVRLKKQDILIENNEFRNFKL